MRKVTSCFVSGFLLVCGFPFFAYASLTIGDVLGGDCGVGEFAASTTWDGATLTCRVTADISDPSGTSLPLDIRLQSVGGVTFDGDGHTVNASITISGVSGDVVKNLHSNGGGLVVTSAPHTTISSVSIMDASSYGLYAFGDITSLTLRNDSFIQTNPTDRFTTYHENIFIYSPVDTSDQSYHIDIDQSNTVDGHVIYYFENQTHTVFDNLPNAGLFYCVECNGVTLSNTTFQSTHVRSQVNIYLSPQTTIASSTIQHAREYGLWMYSSPHSNIHDNVFTQDGVGVELYYSPNTTIQHNLFIENSGLNGVGLELNSGNTGSVVMENTFQSNTFGLVNQSASVTVVHNNFMGEPHDVDNYASSALFSLPLPIGGNYWWNNSHADHECVAVDGVCNVAYTINQFGSSLTDYFPWKTMNGWIAVSTSTDTDIHPPILPPATTTSVSNILFIPGLEASRLYDASSTQLWEPSGDAGVRGLLLDSSGASVESGIRANGVIDTAYAPIFGNIYYSFISDLNDAQSSGRIHAWKTEAYDWRFSPSIIAQGMIDDLEHLAATSPTGKVTIIAHSYGGLVTKSLTELLGSRASVLVDKIIFVAVPQLGTPHAIGALLQGFDQGIGSIFIGGSKLSPDTARSLAHNMSSAYTLIPSQQFFSTSLSNEVVLYNGESIHSSTDLNQFITQPLSGIALAGNDELLQRARAVHTDLDQWRAPSGVTVVTVVGFGEETVKAINYYTGHNHEFMYRPVFTHTGDGTVVKESASYGAREGDEHSSLYWLNIGAYNQSRVVHRKHASIFEIDSLRKLLADIAYPNASSTTRELPEFISTSPPVLVKQSRIHLFLHSPLSLDLYDSVGNHTGVSTSTQSVQRVEEYIPDSRYDQFGEVQHISVPSDGKVYSLAMVAFGSGPYTLDVITTYGDEVVASSTFSGVTSTSSVVTMDIPVSTPVSSSGATSGSSSSASGSTFGGQEVAPYVPKSGVIVASGTPVSISTTTVGNMVDEVFQEPVVTITPAPVGKVLAKNIQFFEEDISPGSIAHFPQDVVQKYHSWQILCGILFLLLINRYSHVKRRDS